LSIEAITQVISSIAIVVALIVNDYQVRQALRQTNVMQHETFGALIESSIDQWSTYLLDRPELLRWFLRTRGYRASTHEENQRRLFALAKLNIHEGVLQHLLQGVREESWIAWLNVLRADLRVDIYLDVWPNGKRFYDVGFARHVDALLQEQ
jgi:hypothetical protein